MKVVGGLRHHAIVVEDLSAAREFYGRLGFVREISGGVPDRDFVQALSGGNWIDLTLVKLANRNGDVLECLRPDFREGFVKTDALSWSHIALTVEDCDQAVASLSKSGALLVGGPVCDPDAPFRVSYLRDPWGNLLEIVQPILASDFSTTES